MSETSSPPLGPAKMQDFFFVRLAIFFSGWTGFALFEKGLFVQISLMMLGLALFFDLPRMMDSARLDRLLSYKHLFILIAFLIFVSLSAFKWDESFRYSNKSEVSAGLRQALSLMVALTFHFVIFLAIQSWEDLKCSLRTYAAGGIIPCIYAGLEVINGFTESRLSPFLGYFQNKNESYNEADLLGTSLTRITFMAPESSIGCIYAMTLASLAFVGFLYKNQVSRFVMPRWLGVLSFGFAILTLAKTIIFPIFALAVSTLLFFRLKMGLPIGVKVILRIFVLGCFGLVIAVGIIIVTRLLKLSGDTVIEDISTWTRIHDFLVGIRMAFSNPIFGVGWGNFTHEYGQYVTDFFSIQYNRELAGHYLDAGKPMILSPYNLYLHVTAEAGIPAGILFVGFLVMPVWRVIGRAASGLLSPQSSYLSLCAAMGGAVVLSSGFSFVSFNTYYFWYFLAACQAIDSNLRLEA